MTKAEWKSYVDAARDPRMRREAQLVHGAPVHRRHSKLEAVLAFLTAASRLSRARPRPIGSERKIVL